MSFQKILTGVYQEIVRLPDPGKVATYIPELGKIAPDKFGACLMTTDGEVNRVGDSDEPFSIQSIAKVLSLCLAFDATEEHILTRVGVEPSGTSFRSLIQLELEGGKPRNPFINAGAIVICDILARHFDDPLTALMHYIHRAAGDDSIRIDPAIADSERATGYGNYALVNFLKSYGQIECDIERVMDFYFRLCAVEMSCRQLAQTFLFLANRGLQPITGERLLDASRTRRINALMQTCGFYDEAGEFAFRVGLPGKSGVGGGIVAVLPGSYSLAVWSPRLNRRGNSFRGMRFLERFTDLTERSVF